MNVAASTSTPSSTSSPGTASAAKNTVQEFSIRVPKNIKKKFNIMRFNSNLNVDFTKWAQVKMERENNKVEKHTGEEMPKYGAGSEYRREEKEEARRKRLGYASRHYNPDDQPWILKCGGKNGKKFRGIREGGVAENAAYYVFTHGSDNCIEAYPAAEWYNFQPIQRFKALSAEEAELEFGKRNKSLNYFSLMKRFGKNEEEEKDEESSSKKKGARDLKISDMDDWIDSDDDDDNESEDNGSDDGREKKKKKAIKKKTVEKKKANNTDESALEESDDGDEEGRELDYISDSSEDISDHEAKVDKELKGVDEEDALRKLLDSDEDEEDEEEKKKEEGNKSDQEEQSPHEETSQSSSAAKKKKKKESPGKSNSDGAKNDDTSSEFSAESSDSDSDKQPKTDVSFDTSQASVSAESPGNSEPVVKKARLDTSTSESSISEEAVRRYLTRKPMTATELLQKFKKPKTNLSSEQLVNVMTQILKKINPIKQTIKNKMYLSLKPENASKSKP